MFIMISREETEYNLIIILTFVYETIDGEFKSY